MVLLLSAASLVVLIAAGLAYLLWLRPEPPAVPQMIRHPIVIPSHTHVTNFLLFTELFRKEEGPFESGSGIGFLER